MTDDTERRRRPRNPPTSIWTDEIRDIVRTAVKLAVDEMLANQHNVLGSISREEHKADHDFVKGWREFVFGAKRTAISGMGDGLKHVVRLLTMILVVAVLFALFGSLMSPSLRHALGAILTAF